MPKLERLCWAVFSLSVVSDSLRPMDSSPPGSSVRGVSQTRILKRIMISYSRECDDIPKKRDRKNQTWLRCEFLRTLHHVSILIEHFGHRFRLVDVLRFCLRRFRTLKLFPFVLWLHIRSDLKKDYVVRSHTLPLSSRLELFSSVMIV